MKRPRKFTARQVASETMKQLQAGADPAKAASYQRYFKEPVAYLGLEHQAMLQIKQELLEWVEGSWTIKD
ncbi:MAG: DNA alkylation repair protein, partial [bacterium]